MESQPAVQKKDKRTRKGRGFSRDELRQTRTNLKQALILGIPIDPRRKTKHEENISALKEHLQELSST